MPRSLACRFNHPKQSFHRSSHQRLLALSRFGHPFSVGLLPSRECLHAHMSVHLRRRSIRRAVGPRHLLLLTARLWTVYCFKYKIRNQKQGPFVESSIDWIERQKHKNGGFNMTSHLNCPLHQHSGQPRLCNSKWHQYKVIRCPLIEHINSTIFFFIKLYLNSCHILMTALPSLDICY